MDVLAAVTKDDDADNVGIDVTSYILIKQKLVGFVDRRMISGQEGLLYIIRMESWNGLTTLDDE